MSAAHEPFTVEEDKVKIPLIMGFLVATVAFIIVAVVATHEYFKIAVKAEIQTKLLDPVNTQLRTLHATEEERLSQYRWVDQKKGVVQIPVERAMELTLRDWPARSEAPVLPAPDPATTPPPATTPAAVVPVPAATPAVAPAKPAEAH